MNSNLNEDQRRQLAAMFLSQGWKILREELDQRAKLAAKMVIYGSIRDTDESNRGIIKAIDMLLTIEKNIFALPEKEAPAPPPTTTDRYGNEAQ